uniref:Pro-neuregulin-4, membrane-bound isoform n=1 Tax=Lepisosteus oculatus TaxID=7918 RepID=W5NBW9_LEPOC
MMTAEHGEPCEESEASYCFNGGLCYRILSISTPSCVCQENYKGSRCEQFQLPSSSIDASEKGMLAAVVILLLLILVALAAVIYCSWKIRRRKEESRTARSDGLINANRV